MRFRAHFSDSEDEEENLSADERPKLQAGRPKTARPDDEDEDMEDQTSDGSYQEESGSEEDDDDETDEDEDGSEDEDESDEDEDAAGRPTVHFNGLAQPPRGPATDKTIIPWARELGVDPQKMHVMQTSLFRMPEEERAMRAATTAQPTSRRRLMLGAGRKHSRDSEGEGLRADSRQRASFGEDIEPPQYRPSRKYARVESSASAFGGNESAYVDAGLAFGRSFRVGWGPRGRLVHLGALCGTAGSSTSPANVSTIKISTVPLLAGAADDASHLASRLLSYHLTHTTIEDDADGVPFADPSRQLTFASLVSQFPSTDHSFEPSLFRLGHALFDPIELGLRDKVEPDILARISATRRKAELSKWLKGAVSSLVDADLRQNLDAKWDTTVFTLLSGYQVERACEVAVDGGNVKLASLISQCPGDAIFREDLQAQLEIWRTQRIDAHIAPNTRKIYGLLAGVADTLEGSGGFGIEQCPDLDLAKDLDWKRAFGLHFWYGQPMDASIQSVFEAFDALWQESRASVASPAPWYVERPALNQTAPNWKLPPPSRTPDALYSLIKLFADPACDLSSVLSPFSFGSSPVDYRLPWHLYVVLSRCLKVRDMADRQDVGENDGENDGGVEGHSPSADLLANSYASQLEQLGMIQEAVFVLLHIEGSAGRAKAIKELLTRSAAKLDDWVTRGLIGSLKLPMAWVNEAKAIHCLDGGRVYDAYELYLAAGMYDAAHDLASRELATDAIIRHDIALLRELFEPFERRIVTSWHERGKTFLDYAHAVTRLSLLRGDPDAAEVEQLARGIPKLVSVLPDALPNVTDVRHKAALAEMTATLMRLLDHVQPLAMYQSQVRVPTMSEAARTRNIHSAMHERFLRTIEVA